MKHSALLTSALALCLHFESAVSNNLWTATWTVPDGAQVQEFSATLTVPSVGGDDEYIWAGIGSNDQLDFRCTLDLSDNSASSSCCPYQPPEDLVFMQPGQELSFFILNQAFGEEGPATTAPQVFHHKAILALEVVDGITWDWGSTQFNYINITANTADLSWCTYPQIDDPTSNGFTWNLSDPEGSSDIDSNTSQCFINLFTFWSPEAPTA